MSVNQESTLFRVPAALVQRIRLRCTNPRIIFSEIMDILYRLMGNQPATPIGCVPKYDGTAATNFIKVFRPPHYYNYKFVPVL